MIDITPTITINEAELKFTFIRAPGPGGQNVNKVATAVVLRFNLTSSPSLSEEVRARLITKLSNKLTLQGDLLIKASRHRTQERNKQDALNRFIEMLKHAATPPKRRRKTKPTFSSIQERLTNKKKQSKTKILRRSQPHKEE